MHIPDSLYYLDTNSSGKNKDLLVSTIINKHFNLSTPTKDIPQINFKDSLKFFFRKK